MKLRTWHGLDDARQVMMRWLVGLTLDEFFRLLDETALDRLWRQRKAFWGHYLKKDQITDAWMILGKSAVRLAALRRDFFKGRFGHLLRNADGDQSVLLLRIAGITIAEWSHNGRCRFWTRANRGAPKYYEHEYNRTDLINECDRALTHQGSWEPRFAAYIFEETGISYGGTRSYR